jgi:hypothetical protein
MSPGAIVGQKFGISYPSPNIIFQQLFAGPWSWCCFDHILGCHRPPQTFCTKEYLIRNINSPVTPDPGNSPCFRRALTCMRCTCIQLIAAAPPSLPLMHTLCSNSLTSSQVNFGRSSRNRQTVQRPGMKCAVVGLDSQSQYAHVQITFASTDANTFVYKVAFRPAAKTIWRGTRNLYKVYLKPIFIQPLL